MSTLPRKNIAENPPDILLTNYMMLELMLTRYDLNVDRQIIENCSGLEFLVLDELHTYRGRQGADVAVLVRRLRERLAAQSLICIGTSATMKSRDDLNEGGFTVETAASKLFGVNITSEEVIGETLRRVTDETSNDWDVLNALSEDIKTDRFRWRDTNYDYTQFRKDPMAIWAELTLGIDMSNDRPERARPLTLEEASKRLHESTGASVKRCEEALSDFLVNVQKVKMKFDKTPFAFKLHQFISGPGKVSSTLEPAGRRTITLDEQQYAPLPNCEDVDVPLFHTYFCRDCGQEYHPVWLLGDKFEQRDIDDVPSKENEKTFGFLAPVADGQNYSGEDDLPSHWFDYRDEQPPKLRSSYKDRKPQQVNLNKFGMCSGSTAFWYLPSKFGFCVRCLASHATQGKDANRLVGLSGEGRSSATTVLTLMAMRELQRSHEDEYKKILGFVDNRQDAALQAGHFNDFVFLLLLRSALLGALENHGGILTEGRLSEAVFEALGFDVDDHKVNTEYMRSPYGNLRERELAKAALYRVLGYRLLHDQRRGWRYNFPNLEKLELLKIDYNKLDDLCRDESVFAPYDKTLGECSPPVREKLFRLVFEWMRTRLCIDSSYLGLPELEKTKHDAAEHLISPWIIEDDELATTGTLTFEKISSNGKQDPTSHHVGARSSLVREVKHAEFMKDTHIGESLLKAKGEEIVDLIKEVIEVAARHGFVQTIPIGKGVPGYRLKPSSLEWKTIESEQKKGNSYFRELYVKTAQSLLEKNFALFDIEAREHTAQVDPETRVELEQRFRNGKKDRQDWEIAHPGKPFLKLPVLYCSPTMELGVDISNLNLVYMRNVPPTPANYAQRSGRAGRSGQTALIITYCAAQSPHDQWYFNNKADIVQGIVRPPVIDLANQDLLNSHLHAIWLSCVEYNLETAIAPLMELDDKKRPLKPELAACCLSQETRDMALPLIRSVAKTLEVELKNAPWYEIGYEEELVKSAADRFDKAFNMWRNLLSATERQRDKAREIYDGFTHSAKEKNDARERARSADNQITLLTSSVNTRASSDFYIYRYLANQNFLPGYNFPRLPLMAWIPGKRGNAKRDGHMVARARFLAISEFGPRSLIYHDGGMFRVVRAKLGAGGSDSVSSGARLATVSIRTCSECGYCHFGEQDKPEPSQNVCERCATPLSDKGRIGELYRVDTVETIPTERITANDEDRQRQGYELMTTYCCPQIVQESEAIAGDEASALLAYSPSARIWRINKGWRRRKVKDQYGFYINPMTGYWSKEGNSDEAESDKTAEDAANEKAPAQLIVPFVEDYKNIVTIKPNRELSQKAFATVQAALAAGITRIFQVENSELAVEPLPNADERKIILFYEAAEGGAGILQRLTEEKGMLAVVAREALRIMHYVVPEGDFSSDEPLQKDGVKSIKCVAGCYSCLLSYYNQPEHKLIDRRDSDAVSFLAELANSVTAPVNRGVRDNKDNGDGALSRWISLLEKSSCNMPDELSKRIMDGQAVIDAFYKNARTAVFIGELSQTVEDYLESKGFRVVLFSFPPNESEWANTLNKHKEIFYSNIGEGSEEL